MSNLAWGARNPEPREPGDLPVWCNEAIAIVLGVVSLLVVTLVTWPPNQRFGDDLGSLILFAVQCSAIASVPTVIYAVGAPLATRYETRPGKYAFHPQAGAVSLTSLVVPWATATFLVVTYVLIIVIVVLAIAALFLAAISTIH